MGSKYSGVSDLPCFKCVIIGPYLIYHDHLLYCVKDLLVTSPPIHVHGRVMYMAKLETVTLLGVHRSLILACNSSAFRVCP